MFLYFMQVNCCILLPSANVLCTEHAVWTRRWHIGVLSKQRAIATDGRCTSKWRGWRCRWNRLRQQQLTQHMCPWTRTINENTGRAMLEDSVVRNYLLRFAWTKTALRFAFRHVCALRKKCMEWKYKLSSCWVHDASNLRCTAKF